MLRHPTHIMIHHSLTPDSQTVSWDDIERFHKSWRRGGVILDGVEAMRLRAQGVADIEAPWIDIGYHAGVERADGAVVSLLGRDWTQNAAACPQGGMNALAMHVCVVGNFDNAPPDSQLLQVLVERIVRPWMRLFSIPADRIVGHHDYNPHKTCPGSKFDLNFLRGLVR